MNRQPTLKGKLLTLRPLVPGDFEALYAAASDPLIWEQHPHRTRHQREVFQGYFDSGIQSGGALVAIDNGSGEVMGSSRYYDFELVEGASVIIGYTFLARKYWGGRYNGEMKRLMLAHAFESVKEVFFQIGETNLRSRTAIARIGAHFVHGTTPGDPLHVTYKIDRAAFTAAENV